MKPISLQLYTLREAAAADFIGVLKQVAEIGYKGVEPAGLYGHNGEQVRKVLDDLGMVASSMHCPLPSEENVNQVIDTAKALGCDKLIGGFWIEEFKTKQTIVAAAERFQAAAELVESHGMKLGYHNHWAEFEQREGQYGLEILLANAPGVFSELDVYWASNFGSVDVPAFIRKYKDKIPLLHVKDGPLVRGEPHTAVGAGKMDIPACIRAADEGVLQWLIVELDECATDMLTAVRQSYQYLTDNKLAAGNK